MRREIYYIPIKIIDVSKKQTQYLNGTIAEAVAKERSYNANNVGKANILYPMPTQLGSTAPTQIGEMII